MTPQTVRVFIDFNDGNYSLITLEASGRDDHPLAFEMSEGEYAAYIAFVDHCNYWHRRLKHLDNEVLDLRGS